MLQEILWTNIRFSENCQFLRDHFFKYMYTIYEWSWHLLVLIRHLVSNLTCNFLAPSPVSVSCLHKVTVSDIQLPFWPFSLVLSSPPCNQLQYDDNLRTDQLCKTVLCWQSVLQII